MTPGATGAAQADHPPADAQRHRLEIYRRTVTMCNRMRVPEPQVTPIGAVTANTIPSP
jgi:hypothetical protein